MFSPTLTKKDVPDDLWLPAEIRVQLEGPVDDYTPTQREILLQKLRTLTDRIVHAETTLARVNIEPRLRALEGRDIPRCRGA